MGKQVSEPLIHCLHYYALLLLSWKCEVFHHKDKVPEDTMGRAGRERQYMMYREIWGNNAVILKSYWSNIWEILDKSYLTEI